jgi:hypothetical protein
VNNLAKKWTRLMGRNSLGCIASECLGSKIIVAELSRCRWRELQYT